MQKIFPQRWESTSNVSVYQKAPPSPFGPGARRKHKKSNFYKKSLESGTFLWKYEGRFWFFHLRISFRCWKTCLHVFMSVNNVQNILQKSKSTKAPLMELLKIIETFNFLKFESSFTFCKRYARMREGRFYFIYQPLLFTTPERGA